jgi:uncharacterized protein YnzC (UPF0291/DUF896 family)
MSGSRVLWGSVDTDRFGTFSCPDGEYAVYSIDTESRVCICNAGLLRNADGKCVAIERLAVVVGEEEAEEEGDDTTGERSGKVLAYSEEEIEEMERQRDEFAEDFKDSMEDGKDVRALKMLGGVKVGGGEITVNIDLGNDYGAKLTDECKQQPMFVRQDSYEVKDVTPQPQGVRSFTIGRTLDQMTNKYPNWAATVIGHTYKGPHTKAGQAGYADVRTDENFRVVYGPYEHLRLRSSYGTLFSPKNHPRLLNNVFLSYGAQILRTQVQSVKSFNHIYQIPLLDEEVTPKNIKNIQASYVSNAAQNSENFYKEKLMQWQRLAKERFDTNVWRPANAFQSKFNSGGKVAQDLAEIEKIGGFVEMDQKEEQTWNMADPYGFQTDSVLEALAAAAEELASTPDDEEPLTGRVHHAYILREDD